MTKVAYIMGDYPEPEFKRRADCARSYSSQEVEISVLKIQGTAYAHGTTPADTELVIPAFVDAYREAERQGFDAAVPLGTLDLGVDAGRCAVDIPIIGPIEAMLHLGSMFGHRMGLIMYHDSLLPLGYRLVERFKMADRVVGWRTAGFDVPDIASNHDSTVANFMSAARELIEKDRADVILPFGITMCPIHIKPDQLAKELGVPVVEGIGAPLRLAAMAAQLGLKQSRKYWPKQR